MSLISEQGHYQTGVKFKIALVWEPMTTILRHFGGEDQVKVHPVGLSGLMPRMLPISHRGVRAGQAVSQGRSALTIRVCLIREDHVAPQNCLQYMDFHDTAISLCITL